MTFRLASSMLQADQVACQPAKFGALSGRQAALMLGSPKQSLRCPDALLRRHTWPIFMPSHSFYWPPSDLVMSEAHDLHREQLPTMNFGTVAIAAMMRNPAR